MTIANKIIDPVCGMTVVPERAAAHVSHKGQDFHFCSKGCAAKFQQDPERLLAAPGSSPMGTNGRQAELVQLGSRATTASSAGAYVCPMDPEVRSNKPGA